MNGEIFSKALEAGDEQKMAKQIKFIALAWKMYGNRKEKLSKEDIVL